MTNTKISSIKINSITETNNNCKDNKLVVVENYSLSQAAV